MNKVNLATGKMGKETISSLPYSLTTLNPVTPSGIATTHSEEAEFLKPWYHPPPCQILNSLISIIPDTQLKCLYLFQFLRWRFQLLPKSRTPSKQQAAIASHFSSSKVSLVPLSLISSPSFKLVSIFRTTQLHSVTAIPFT